MSDEHTGLPHDLPEYVPNWPVSVPVKVKAKVYRLSASWGWSHSCPHRPFGVQRITVGHGHPTQPAAFAAALKHARGCW
jgi:hypothetical protein